MSAAQFSPVKTTADLETSISNFVSTLSATKGTISKEDVEKLNPSERNLLQFCLEKLSNPSGDQGDVAKFEKLGGKEALTKIHIALTSSDSTKAKIGKIASLNLKKPDEIVTKFNSSVPLFNAKKIGTESYEQAKKICDELGMNDSQGYLTGDLKSKLSTFELLLKGSNDVPAIELTTKDVETKLNAVLEANLTYLTREVRFISERLSVISSEHDELRNIVESLDYKLATLTNLQKAIPRDAETILATINVIKATTQSANVMLKELEKTTEKGTATELREAQAKLQELESIIKTSESYQRLYNLIETDKGKEDFYNSQVKVQNPHIQDLVISPTDPTAHQKKEQKLKAINDEIQRTKQKVEGLKVKQAQEMSNLRNLKNIQTDNTN